MKAKTLSVLAGVSAPLILSGSTDAGFVGIRVFHKLNDYGLFVCNVYATFDRPGEDLMIAVAGTPDQPLDIRVNGGTFFQHLAGTDRSPLGALISVFPSLAFDTFVTIGVKQVGPSIDGNPGQPNDNLTLTPGWPGFGDSQLFLTNAGWAVTPDEPQADPFNPLFYRGDGQVLIGQFSTADGITITGTMLLQYFDNGISQQAVVSFGVPTPGALALLATAGLLGLTRRRR